VTNWLGGAFHIENRVVVAPDGSKAAFDVRVPSGPRIFVIDLTAPSRVSQLTRNPTPSLIRNDTFPTWVGSDQVAFGSDLIGEGHDSIYILPADRFEQVAEEIVADGTQPCFGPN